MDSDAIAQGIVTVVGLYAIFAACRWVWQLIVRGAHAARRHAPDALENTAKATGKATKQASALASKLKRAFDEGRK